MTHPLMRLITLHGRDDPKETLEDWGYDGPSIDGIRTLHMTYMSTMVLHFETEEFAQACIDATGWEAWDENAVELKFHDDLLWLPKPGQYFGDWELQTVTGSDLAIPQTADRFLQSLVADVEKMQTKFDPNQFGQFEGFQTMDGKVSIEWPNLSWQLDQINAYLKGVAS